MEKELKPNLYLRKVTLADCDLLYLWCNDSQCRANSLDSRYISYQEHCEWFSRMTASLDCQIYICMEGENAVGQVRLNMEENEGRISYSIAAVYRGRSFGDRMLQLLEGVMPQRIEKLHAVVKKGNIASQRCFEKLGYQKKEGEGVYHYWKTKEIAILMAAGLGSRMRPLTETIPKPLVPVRGTPMVETVIESLRRRGVMDIFVVVGYLKEQFEYLEKKYCNIRLIQNRDYNRMNNISSIYAASHVLGKADCFICEADLYVADPAVFDVDLQTSCYFGRMMQGYSDDWVFTMEKDRIIHIGKGGSDTYNMTGVSYFRKGDAKKIADAVTSVYSEGGHEELFWDEVVDGMLEEMELTIYPVKEGQIVEIDTLEELEQVQRDH